MYLVGWRRNRLEHPTHFVCKLHVSHGSTWMHGVAVAHQVGVHLAQLAEVVLCLEIVNVGAPHSRQELFSRQRIHVEHRRVTIALILVRHRPLKGKQKVGIMQKWFT